MRSGNSFGEQERYSFPIPSSKGQRVDGSESSPLEKDKREADTFGGPKASADDRNGETLGK